MSVGNFVKSIQNLMRGDSGVNGDAQRIEQMTWLIFLKVYDAKESDWEDDDMTTIISNPFYPKIFVGAIGLSMTKAARL